MSWIFPRLHQFLVWCFTLLRHLRPGGDLRSLALENLALRQQLALYRSKDPKRRPTRYDRLFWMFLSRLWEDWRDALVIVRPATVLRWHRAGFRAFWRWRSRSRGRQESPESRALRRHIQRMARENPSWGAPRIHGELRALGFEVSERTVSRWMPRRDPDPKKRQSWRTFRENHREALAGMDLFTVPTATFRVLYAWFFLEHSRRRVAHIAVTEHPTASWVHQQLREALGPESSVEYLIHDNDPLFVRDLGERLGVKTKRTAPRSPWQNGVSERFVGSVRRELLDHVIVLDERHLTRLLREYVAYYNQDRTHLALGKESPEGRSAPARASPLRELVAEPRLGGLHHRYALAKAA